MEMTVAAVLVASLVGFGTAVMLATAVVVVTDLEGVTVAEVLADTFLLTCVGTIVAQDYSVVFLEYSAVAVAVLANQWVSQRSS